MDYNFWKKQDRTGLFPEIEWNRPEQRSRAGKIAIIGGNKFGFAAESLAVMKSQEAGVGEAVVLLPESLKKKVPAVAGIEFGAANESGGFGKEARRDFERVGELVDGVVVLGDLGKNAQTVVSVGEFAKQYKKRLIITRDGVDAVMEEMGELIQKENLMIIGSFGQMQKIFRTVLYPKVLTFSMNLTQLVEALHKFTLTYPLAVATLHGEQFVAAKDGEVVSTPLEMLKYSPLTLWSGELAVTALAYWIWNPNKPLEAISAAVLK